MDRHDRDQPVTLTPVEELVDGGGQAGDGRSGVFPDYCVRWCPRHQVHAHPGFSFCRDCLAWLRGESDDDPLDDGAELAKKQTPPELWAGHRYVWRAYMEILAGGAAE